MRQARPVDADARRWRRRSSSEPNGPFVSSSADLTASTCVPGGANSLECAEPAGSVAKLSRESVIASPANVLQTAPSSRTTT